MNKYYAVLGLTSTATKDDVRRAFRKLAFQWHPDRNSAPGASEKFMAINEAYEILIGERKAPGYTSGTGTAYSTPRPREKTAYERGRENINRIHETRKRKFETLREEYLKSPGEKEKMYREAYTYFAGAGGLLLFSIAAPLVIGAPANMIWTIPVAIGLGMRLVWRGGRIKLRADMIFSGRNDYSFEDLKEFFLDEVGVRYQSGGRRGAWPRW